MSPWQEPAWERKAAPGAGCKLAVQVVEADRSPNASPRQELDQDDQGQHRAAGTQTAAAAIVVAETMPLSSVSSISQFYDR